MTLDNKFYENVLANNPPIFKKEEKLLFAQLLQAEVEHFANILSWSKVVAKFDELASKDPIPLKLPTTLDVEHLAYFMKDLSYRRYWLRKMTDVALTSPNKDYVAIAKQSFKKVNQLKEKIIKGNLVLVASIARRYGAKNVALIEDLTQEGNLVLINAVDHFDIFNGTRFTTYVYNCILNSLFENIKNIQSCIELNKLHWNLLSKYHNAHTSLFRSLGKEPTREDIAGYLQVPVENVENLLKIEQSTRYITHCFNPVEQSEHIDIFDLLSDPNEDHDMVANHAEKSILQGTVKDLLSDTLTESENDIVVKLFGLDNDPQMTLQSIGNDYNRTRERIRQIRVKAFSKLRKSAAVTQLKACL